MLSQNPKPATFITFKDKYVLTDGSRSLEIYKLQGDNHNELMSIGYLPKEKILIEADDFTPPPPNGPATGAGRVGLRQQSLRQLAKAEAASGHDRPAARESGADVRNAESTRQDPGLRCEDRRRGWLQLRSGQSLYPGQE